MISFTIEGLMGQFRRYYTTVTSLTYAFPPRNTVVGIIAAILGLEKDSYYDLFSRDNSKVSLQILTPVRKVSFSTNYLDTDEVSYRRLRGEGTSPSRIEYVMSLDGSPLKYKIFLEHKDTELMDRLRSKLSEGKSHYSLSLGPANCLASLNGFEYIDVEITRPERNVELEIVTIVRQDQMKMDPVKNKGKQIMIEERVPPDFKGGRLPASKSMNYIYEANCKPLTIFLDGEVYRIGDKYGTFL